MECGYVSDERRIRVWSFQLSQQLSEMPRGRANVPSIFQARPSGDAKQDDDDQSDHKGPDI
eukprot:5219519-Pleurochrysis_carterae.AAC.1